MRRILGFILIGLAFLALTAESSSSCAKNNNGSSSSNSNNAGSTTNTAAKATAAPKTTQAPPALGDVLKVGDLDLTLANPRSFDSTQYNQFNSQDYAVDVTLSNTRGDKYRFSPSYVKIVDSSGVVHEGTSFCTGCPKALESTEMVKGGHAEGVVYFKLAGATPKELDYQPLLSSNKVAIPLAP